MKKSIVLLSIIITISLFAQKADVIEGKIKKSYGGSYIADVKIRHHDINYSDYVSEWQILDQDRKPITVRLEFAPKPEKEIIESELIGFKIPKGTKKIIIRAKCSKDGYGGKEFVIKIPSEDENASRQKTGE